MEDGNPFGHNLGLASASILIHFYANLCSATVSGPRTSSEDSCASQVHCTTPVEKLGALTAGDPLKSLVWTLHQMACFVAIGLPDLALRLT